MDLKLTNKMWYERDINDEHYSVYAHWYYQTTILYMQTDNIKLSWIDLCTCKSGINESYTT